MIANTLALMDSNSTVLQIRRGRIFAFAPACLGLFSDSNAADDHDATETQPRIGVSHRCPLVEVKTADNLCTEYSEQNSWLTIVNGELSSGLSSFE